MKRKVAVFAGGWGGEYLQEVVCGIADAARQENTDLFTFVNFSVHGDILGTNDREFNIYTLPDLNDFDGIILLANSFNMTKEVEYFAEKLKEIEVPVVSVEYKFENVTSICTNNYAGMYDLAQHVITQHGARNLLFIGGPKEHMESAERLKAVQDAAEENGFFIPEANICYGDWAKNSAMDLVKNWLKENGALPDAILCANDIMAMGVCECLDNMNYRVPEDVIVTGYDCLRDAREYQPSITSVNHEWGRMGTVAMQMIVRKWQGETVEDTVLNTRFVSGRSCGCNNAEHRISKRQLMRIKRKREFDDLASDSHFRHIYLAVRKTENVEELSESLSYRFAQEHQMEGKDFMLCLDPEFFRIEEDDLNLHTLGHSEKMEVVGSIRNGISQPHISMSKKDAMFAIAREKEEPGIYIYVPVYSDFKVYGFAILTTGDMDIACDNQLYIWTRHMNQYMEQVRRNITIADLTRKLTQLSVTDALTGVYNRAGCEEIAYPMLQEWKENGGTGVIMLVDVDKMKQVNDRHGHANGDLALRTVATVLKQTLPEDWIISRFGGDEFFVAGCIRGEDVDLVALRDSLEEALAKEVKRREITFRLTFSIGGVKAKPGDDIDIEKYLQLADEDMYEIKSAHHKAFDEEQ